MRVLFLFLFVASMALGQNIERRLKEVSHDAEYAVIPVWYADSSNISNQGVVGTAFFVTADGYFVTAAHVLEQYFSKSGQMTIGISQRSGHVIELRFDVVEKDDPHDLALCKANISFRAFRQYSDNPGTEQPIASLRVSAAPASVGQFIAIAGFPLGSWNPAIQFGTVAAIRTTNPNAGRVPAGQRELLQISASGNKGNSGSPVIDLDTGAVVGVIVQAQPAPLFSALEGVPLTQSS